MREFLAKVCRGEALTEAEASGAMERLMDGEATPAQIGALLGAIAARGETEDELVGFARAMRARGTRIEAADAVDLCGTGGDGAGTLNVSTLASLVVAACGVPVAKHGNRSVSSRCGSADLVEALGVPVDVPPEAVERSIREAGWGFLFAPAFHSSTRHAAGPRRELGVRTAFNLLGPLTNPAYPVAQLVGVPRAELTTVLARCLARLGVRNAWVVHGDGLDELSPSTPSTVAAWDGTGVRTFEVRPEDAGLPRRPRASILCAAPEENAQRAHEVLDGVHGAAMDVVCLNAAAALVVAGRARDLKEGARQASEAVLSGRAKVVLDDVRKAVAP